MARSAKYSNRSSELVFRLVRRPMASWSGPDGEAIYWSGPHDPQELAQDHGEKWFKAQPGEEVRHLSVADAFDAAVASGVWLRRWEE
jgi:hypothetical protein